MRWTHAMTCALFALALSACSSDDPACEDTDCVHPPADTCLDANTLKEYAAQGACDPGTGECAYDHTDRACQNGCTVDHCESSDPCDGVVCDQPPDNRCDDASTLWIYDAQGTCVRPQGTCEYGHTERTCENGCLDGLCSGEDLCEGVVCDQPPPARCVDEDTVEEFDPSGTCDPATGRCDYESTQRDCPDGCIKGVCLDLGDDYALVIPAGTQVCNDRRSTWDVYGDYQTRMRISFRGGTVSLPVDEDSFDRDWIESIEFGPKRETFTPLANGTFTRTAGVDRVDYQFVQEFSDGETTYTLTGDVWFDATKPEDRVRVFDELYLSPPLTYPPNTLELVVDEGEHERWAFYTCTFDLYLPVLHRVVTEDGAQLELEERTYPSSDWCMLACPTGLRRAGFELGQDLREVQDPFRLSFVDGQHNWHDQFLVVFDEPVGDIHAVYYYPDDNDAPEKKVDYLNAALEVNGQSLVVSHHTVELRNSFDSEAIPVDTCGEYCRDYVGLAEDCEDSCVLQGQALAGRCLPTGGWPPDDDWTPIDSCDTTFDTCAAAGKPFIQCCCSRIASDW